MDEGALAASVANATAAAAGGVESWEASTAAAPSLAAMQSEHAAALAWVAAMAAEAVKVKARSAGLLGLRRGSMQKPSN